MTSTEKFIEKCKNIHGDKYLYEKVEYIGNRINIIITCKKHGDFNQRPHNHLIGKGCPSCSGNKPLIKDVFIEKSKIKHNNIYDYSLVNYVNSNTQVDIICKIHGIFKQLPKKHKNGSGCQKCGGSEKLTKEDFITKSNKIHYNRYDYSLVIYKGNKYKIDILCKEHGIFKQLPSNHLKGFGCSKCSNKHIPNNIEFIEKANRIHNNLYKYDKVNYINCKTKIDIECSKHGIFKQTPNSHLTGRGCQKCKGPKSEDYIENYLISNNIRYEKQFKFNDLKYKNKLKFDFAILDEENNIKFLIEYNGEQHYIFRGQFGMKIKDFETILIRDKIKMDYCVKNGIDIHVIKYTENINSRLNQIFS
jgi:hypothetical protein